MINGKKVVIVLPAYNAAKTLMKTYAEIPFDITDDVILVDDHSLDDTVALAHSIGIRHVIRHPINKGYGGNQKTCYDFALALDADIIVMLHPDYQYTPKLISSICFMIANDVFPVVLGSRILGNGALKGGMPVYKYLANRFLTLLQNTLMGQKLSEYHTGYRAFSRTVLKNISYHRNSDDFLFDNQLLAQILSSGFEIGEISCPTNYDSDCSSISFKRSVIYGFGVITVSIFFFLNRARLYRHPMFTPRSGQLTALKWFRA
ncbi:MAG TPA: glycosyltransferase family 2 protein [Chryseosolibacter sp.]